MKYFKFQMIILITSTIELHTFNFVQVSLTLNFKVTEYSSIIKTKLTNLFSWQDFIQFIEFEPCVPYENYERDRAHNVFFVNLLGMHLTSSEGK